MQLDGYFSERFSDFLHTDYPRYDAGINCTFVGPGHGTPIKLANGSDFWYVYHTWKYDAVGTVFENSLKMSHQVQFSPNSSKIGFVEERLFSFKHFYFFFAQQSFF